MIDRELYYTNGDIFLALQGDNSNKNVYKRIILESSRKWANGLRDRLSSPLVFFGGRVAYLFSFLYCFVFFVCFVCRRSVSCVFNVASFSGLFILDCPFCFL
jgi:hypothetical protein